MDPIQLSLTIPGHIDYLSVAIVFIKMCAEKFGCSENEIYKINLGAEEALTSIILKALNNNPEEECTLICRQFSTRMEIVIQDKGIPFALDDIPDFNPEFPDDPENMDGLGLYLMKQAVDEVQFKNLGVNGKETLLVINFESKRIDNIIADQKTQVEVCDPVTNWSIRSFCPEDAIEISRCAYEAYGYTYTSFIYFPEQITEMNEKNQLLSIIAETEGQNLMGHIALNFDQPANLTAELGVAFVRPAYRKLNLFSKMNKAMIEMAQERQMYGIYTHAVTSHTISQKQGEKLGMVVCGVVLGYTHSEFDFKALSGKSGQRESTVLFFLPLNSPKRNIYPPASHQKIITKIFTRLSMDVSMRDPENPSSEAQVFQAYETDEAKLSYTRTEVFNTASIFCYSGEPSIVEEIRSVKKILCVERMDVLYLYIDLESPGCPDITKTCEKMGFFFCGVRPFGLNGRHTLILQFLNNVKIDYDNINLHNPFAGEMLNYIKACEPR